MADAASLAAAEEYLAFLAGHAHGDDGPADPATLGGGPAASRLFRSLERGATPAAVVERLAAGVATLPDPLAAGVLASQVGALIEDGADPAPLGQALTTRLPADLAAARRFVALVEIEAGVERPDDADAATLARLGRRERAGASAWAAQRFATPAAMAAWCRHRPSRLAARVAPGLAEDAAFLGSRGGYSYFLGELLSAADGTELTVLSPEQHKGFVVDLEVVRNAAHLFALLEDTLIGDPADGLLTGPRTDPHAAAVARGEVDIGGDGFFNIRWHYEYWYGLAPDAAARVLGLHPAVAAMIGVEATLPGVPPFRGRQLILMRPAMMKSRSCDLSFFTPLHDALRSRVTVLRHLPAAEVDALCADLRAEAQNLR